MAFTYLKVKSAKCHCLLQVVLVLVLSFWSWSWSCNVSSGLGHVTLVLVLRIWSCLHHWYYQTTSRRYTWPHSGVERSKFKISMPINAETEMCRLFRRGRPSKIKLDKGWNTMICINDMRRDVKGDNGITWWRKAAEAQKIDRTVVPVRASSDTAHQF